MNKKFLSTTFMVFLALLICKLSAFLQEIVVAAKLGATVTGDAFNMVFGIQQTIYPMLAVGISQIFFPEYKALLSKNEKRHANVLASYSVVIFTAFSVIVVLCLLLFSDAIVSFTAPGFNIEQHQQTVYMVRLSAISYIFVCAASVISCILMANGHFFVSEVRGAFSHIPIIIAALLFYDRFGISALALAIAIAGLLRLLIQIPFLIGDYSFQLRPRPEKQYVKSLLRLLPPALLSSGISQLNTFVDKMLASKLPVGSVSCLNYGGRVFSVLQELMGNIVATSSYPQIIEYTAQQKKDELGNFLYELFNMMLILTIPITLGGIVFSRSIIDVLFVRGKFTSDMGLITSRIFSLYLIALPLSSLRGIINNVCFANKNTRVPMIVNGANLGLNIILNVVLMRFLGIAGLALATSVSSVFCVSYNLFYIRRYTTIDYKKTLLNVAKIVASTVVALLVGLGVIKATRISGSFLTIVIAISITVPVYFALVKCAKIDVTEMFTSKLLSRVKKR